MNIDEITMLNGVYPYRNILGSIPDADAIFHTNSNIRNEQKHMETCLKNRKKRKSKKR